MDTVTALTLNAIHVPLAHPTPTWVFPHEPIFSVHIGATYVLRHFNNPRNSVHATAKSLVAVRGEWALFRLKATTDGNCRAATPVWLFLPKSVARDMWPMPWWQKLLLRQPAFPPPSFGYSLALGLQSTLDHLTLDSTSTVSINSSTCSVCDGTNRNGKGYAIRRVKTC